jgi:hypothetical protein
VAPVYHNDCSKTLPKTSNLPLKKLKHRRLLASKNSQIYLSKHVYYLGIQIGSQVKHPVIEFDILTLGYFTDNNSTQPEIPVNRIRDNESQLYNEAKTMNFTIFQPPIYLV